MVNAKENPICMECKIFMEKREITPCYSCGGNPKEKTHKHDFYKCYLLDNEIIFCDFCYADFPGHYPSYFGLKFTHELDDMLKFESKIKIDSKIDYDFVCPKCNMRLIWQDIIQNIRKKVSLRNLNL